MGILQSMAKVTEARARVAVARVETVAAAAGLIARGYEHPLTVLGIAAGSGFLLSKVNISPFSVPGVSSVLAGGSADLIGKIVSIAAGHFLGDLASGAVETAEDAP